MVVRPLLLAVSFLLVLPQVAYAQIRPGSSGKTSFNAPQMRRHHSGLKLPNQPGSPRVGYHKRHKRFHRLHLGY